MNNELSQTPERRGYLDQVLALASMERWVFRSLRDGEIDMMRKREIEHQLMAERGRLLDMAGIALSHSVVNYDEIGGER